MSVDLEHPTSRQHAPVAVPFDEVQLGEQFCDGRIAQAGYEGHVTTKRHEAASHFDLLGMFADDATESRESAQRFAATKLRRRRVVGDPIAAADALERRAAPVTELRKAACETAIHVSARSNPDPGASAAGEQNTIFHVEQAARRH